PSARDVVVSVDVALVAVHRRRVHLLTFFTGFANRHLPVGAAVSGVFLIPLRAEARRLTEQAVHLHGVTSTPERQQAAQGRVRLGLARVPRTIACPQAVELLGVACLLCLCQHIVIGENRPCPTRGLRCLGLYLTIGAGGFEEQGWISLSNRLLRSCPRA